MLFSSSLTPRRFERKSYQCKTIIFEWDLSHEATIHEISGGGAFVSSSKFIDKGKFITLRIALPNSSSKSTILGKVVHHNETKGRKGMGVEFVDIQASAQNALVQFTR